MIVNHSAMKKSRSFGRDFLSELGFLAYESGRFDSVLAYELCKFCVFLPMN